MGIRKSSSSRYRFDFPIKTRGVYFTSSLKFVPGIYEDCTDRDKAGVPGPLNRAQFVELLWRVRCITLKCKITFTHQEETGEGEPVDIQTKTCSLDLKVLRQKGAYARSGEADEDDVFSALFSGFGDYYSGKAEWSGSNNPNGDSILDNGDSYGGMVVNPFIYALQKDKDNNFWLHNTGSYVSAGFPSYFYCFARANFQFPSVVNPGQINYLDFQVSAGTGNAIKIDRSDYRNFSGKLNIQGEPVNFPLEASIETQTFGAILNITSATASVEITEWFEYATTKGLPAWDKLTGRPINGGPAA